MTLSLGFTVILALVVCSSAFALVEGRRSERNSRRAIVEAQQSAHVVGYVRYIGQQVSRVRAKTQQALIAGHVRRPVAEQITEINGDIDAALRQLSPLLSPAERAEWHRITPILDELRTTLERAFGEMRQGRSDAVRGALRKVAPLSARFFALSEEFHAFCASETEAKLKALTERAAWTRRLQVSAAILLFVLTSVVAVAVIRLTAKQQDKLVAYLSEIESANSDLEAFAGRVAHDIKNVLQPLVLAAPKLTSSADNPDAVRKIAARMGRIARRAAEIVDGLLAFARSSAPVQSDQSASMNAELRAVLDELAPAADRVDATIHLDAEPSLETACAASLLHVVLLNVIGNALKFLDGCQTREVRISARKEGDWCVVEIADTGPGIPREALAKVFEPFFRGRNSGAPGAGIGLATVRRIVEGHHGHVSLTSTEGMGTRVRVQMPVAPPAGSQHFEHTHIRARHHPRSERTEESASSGFKGRMRRS